MVSGFRTDVSRLLQKSSSDVCSFTSGRKILKEWSLCGSGSDSMCTRSAFGHFQVLEQTFFFRTCDWDFIFEVLCSVFPCDPYVIPESSCSFEAVWTSILSASGLHRGSWPPPLHADSFSQHLLYILKHAASLRSLKGNALFLWRKAKFSTALRLLTDQSCRKLS